jgi:peptide/nickel transport system permease protein
VTRPRLVAPRRANLLIGGLFTGLMLLFALTGMLFTPYDPLATDLAAKLEPPSAIHWFGTDQYGRDVFSRVVVAASVSATVSLASVVFALFAGTLLGLVSGYVRGWVDRAVMMLLEAIMAFPGILLALGIMAAVGPNKWGIIVALGIAFTPSVARVTRATVLSLREKEFVEASRAMGNSEAWTILRHVLPNCVAPLIIMATTLFGVALLAESALSFLGLGVPPPSPTWGGMLSDSRQFMRQAAWLALFPGLAISISLLGINLLGDALRDRLDPRMRGI